MGGQLVGVSKGLTAPVAQRRPGLAVVHTILSRGLWHRSTVIVPYDLSMVSADDAVRQLEQETARPEWCVTERVDSLSLPTSRLLQCQCQRAPQPVQGRVRDRCRPCGGGVPVRDDGRR